MSELKKPDNFKQAQEMSIQKWRNIGEALNRIYRQAGSHCGFCHYHLGCHTCSALLICGDLSELFFLQLEWIRSNIFEEIIPRIEEVKEI